MKKVVVTGGAGFIGSHLVEELILHHYEVHVIDNFSAGKREHVPAAAHLHEQDIRDREAITPIIKGAQYVFHLAAMPQVQYSIEEPVITHEVNVTGLLNVLVAAQQGGVKKVIFSASSAAYGNQRHMPLTEEMPAEPLSPYGLHKYLGERYCRVWSEVYGLPTVSLRYFNVYGPRSNPQGPYASVIGKFIMQHEAHEPLTVTGDGTQTRDFVHVRDVVRANLLAAESTQVSQGEVMNIGSGSAQSVRRIAELVGGEILYLPARLEPKESRADISRARQLLGWAPAVAFEEGLKELLK